MLLARAGVVRLGREHAIGEILPAAMMLPAVGQGALGVEIRAGDREMQTLVVAINHHPTEQATTAERALLKKLEGGCQIPVGAYARIEVDGGHEELVLDAMVGSLDGKHIVRDSLRGVPEEAQETGVALGERLLAQGADEILSRIRSRK
jgi:hydroxymethylbilane synthase